MASADKELDRVLTLLRNKIREKGFTQIEVQEALSWGRSYISQILTKQKSQRVEQVLLMLEVIGVEPGEFFAELYHYPPQPVPQPVGRGVDDYPPGLRGRAAPFNPSTVHELSEDPLSEDFSHSFEQIRDLLRGMVRLLVDKSLVSVDEVTAAVKALTSKR